MNVSAKKSLVLAQLAATPLFDRITASQLKPLEKDLDIRSELFERGELVLSGKQPACRLCLVQKGLVCARMCGQPAEACSFGPGHIIGLESIFCNDEYSKSEYIAVNEVKLLRFDPGPMLNAVSPEVRQIFLENWIACLSGQTTRLNTTLYVLSQRSLRDKILAFAYIMCSRSGSDTFDLNMTQNQLAAYLRVARPSLSRELRILKKESILKVDGRKYTVLRPPWSQALTMSRMDTASDNKGDRSVCIK